MGGFRSPLTGGMRFLAPELSYLVLGVLILGVAFRSGLLGPHLLISHRRTPLENTSGAIVLASFFVASAQVVNSLAPRTASSISSTASSLPCCSGTPWPHARPPAAAPQPLRHPGGGLHLQVRPARGPVRSAGRPHPARPHRAPRGSGAGHPSVSAVRPRHGLRGVLHGTARPGRPGDAPHRPRPDRARARCRRRRPRRPACVVAPILVTATLGLGRAILSFAKTSSASALRAGDPLQSRYTVLRPPILLEPPQSSRAAIFRCRSPARPGRRRTARPTSATRPGAAHPDEV